MEGGGFKGLGRDRKVTRRDLLISLFARLPQYWERNLLLLREGIVKKITDGQTQCFFEGKITTLVNVFFAY